MRKRRANRNSRSTQAEHREILHESHANENQSSFERLAADLRTLTKRRKQTPSEVLLREGVRSGECIALSGSGESATTELF